MNARSGDGPTRARRRATNTAAMWAGWAYGIAAVGAVALTIAGVLRDEIPLVGMGLLGLVVVAAAAPVSLAAALRESGSRDTSIDTRLDQLARSIEHMVEEAALSDDARRVLNRRRERELLCQAIEEDILSEDWDAAMILVKELAERFGYRAEAEHYRERIETARFETVERRVAAAIQHLDELITQRRWESADAEAGRIARLYPDSPRIEGLRHRVRQARQLYKEDLERRFLHAAREDRIDHAMQLLTELDAYLTEAEGEQYQELARGVIGKARDNLGAQFKLAVHDRRWREAAQIGESIIESFPNSRMADEVRNLIDGIRQKALAVRA